MALDHSIPLHELRHFPLTWWGKQSVIDALLQLYSRHAFGQSPKVYSRLMLGEMHQEYDWVIVRRPV